MSSNIWTQCGGLSNVRQLRLKPWRVVEAQHIASTLKLVGSRAEQELLEELIDRRKPALPSEPAFVKLDYLLFTPFRYPPLRHGSRFGRRDERGIWYGSESRRTVFSEKAYYRFLFLSGTAANLVPMAVEQTAFRADVDSQAAIDLAASPFDSHRSVISSKTRYEDSQQLGRAMRNDGIEVLRYASARDSKDGVNVALFTPRAFARPRPHSRQTWICVADASTIRFTQKQPFEQGQTSFSFERKEFEVDGALPAPAL